MALDYCEMLRQFVQGLAVLPRADIDGLLGLSQSTLCRWVGGLGHELGHAVGLDHPPGCDADQSQKPCKSLMYLGYLSYDRRLL